MSNKTDFKNVTYTRAMGSETEFTTQFSAADRDLRILVPESQQLPDKSDIETQLWLKNGGRIYHEWGDLIEYATPECRNAHEVALYEKAGHATLRSVARSYAPLLGRRESANVFKRSGYVTVLGNDGNILLMPESAGHHENYQSSELSRNLDEASFSREALASYLATRPIWSGTGLVTHGGYAISQKGMAIRFEGSKDRSLVDHGNKHGFLQREPDRLEIRSGEGNMSEWAIVQKFAFTSLVLRLIEQKKIPESLLLHDPTFFLKSLSDKLDKRTASIAVAHQRRFAEIGLDFAEGNPGVPEEEKTAAKEIIRTCDQIYQYLDSPDALSLISDRVDWAAKFAYIKSRGIRDSEINSTNLSAVMHDLTWEDIEHHRPSERWYSKVQPSMFSDADIRRAQVIPPHTRAKKRCEILRDLDGYASEIDWSSIKAFQFEAELPNPATDEARLNGSIQQTLRQHEEY